MTPPRIAFVGLLVLHRFYVKPKQKKKRWTIVVISPPMSGGKYQRLLDRAPRERKPLTHISIRLAPLPSAAAATASAGSPAMRSFRFRLYSLSPPLLCCKWSRELRLHRYAMLMMTTKIALGRYHMRLSEKSRCLPCLHAPATGSLSFLRGHLHKSL